MYLYNYLVGKEDYSPENLSLFKSLLGIRLFRDGYVEDLKYSRPLDPTRTTTVKLGRGRLALDYSL